MNPPLRITRETEFYQGFIRFKMSITNESPSIIADVILDFYFEEALLRIDRHEPDFQLKNDKIFLGNIHSGESKSVAVYFDPLMCSRGTEINCQVTYRDAGGRLGSAFMEPKVVSVVCPILYTDSDINVGRLKEFIEVLPSRDSKVYNIQNGFDISSLVHIAREVVEKHDVRHIRTFRMKDGKECEIWYYGKTKVHQENLVIKISLRFEKQSLELFVTTERAETLTGFLAEVGRNLKNSLETRATGRGNVTNLTIKDSIIQRSNLLDHCDMDGRCSTNIIVEDSVIQHSSISSGRAGRAPPEMKTGIRIDVGESETFRKQQEELNHLRKEIEELQRHKENEDRLRQEREHQEKQKEEKEKLRQELERLMKQKEEEAEKLRKQREARKLEAPKTLTCHGIEFVHIPVGEFMMGSNEYDTGNPIHKVKIGISFYLGKYPVTQKQWKAVMGSNPSHFKGDDLPVEKVSWYDVQEFIEKLNGMESTNKYRLPSEVEWEYACRAGTKTGYYFGDSESKLGDYAWYRDNSNKKTHSVGHKKPNPWDLYDMHGNVWEWCQGRGHGNYDSAPFDGSARGNISAWVVRGGSWFDNADSCRSADCSRVLPDCCSFDIGFRLLREL
ncbi:hypothetical protein MSMTP_2820 [Methanosarcina sp. MTP4]|uniref:SUMF1/EgtB/PvdO family nonheme iron enzyme n=1 Tax=Methanosarcina sp. MTP4 TaxID=1434100 RepID=UPI000616012F|nr:SUMF1/EgtB/PvdO family nonheme iron enzyme [Methanosarcina sp. MTP4]AKB26289.1 hypothetical protein MSMTP_2820 [Methanosarcina sp. MTP4]